MDEGRDPADPAVQAVIGERYRQINARYYPCTPEVFRGLGELYVADSRFTEYHERMWLLRLRTKARIRGLIRL